MTTIRLAPWKVFVPCIAAMGVLLIVQAARAGTDPADACKSSKAKAVGKKAEGYLKAFGKDAKKNDGTRLASSLSKSESKYRKSHTKAESKGGCVTTGDGALLEACVDDFVRDVLCEGAVSAQTLSIASDAEPAETPGTLGVDNSDYPKLVTMFGGTGFSLNKATYTRYYCGDGSEQPDAILILVPGFEGGASSFKILAENAIPRARARDIKLEVWAYDRRGHQIEDREGVQIAENLQDANVALDWLYGGELGLTLSPPLVSGPNRRAEFHDGHADTAFIANWTPLVHSRDLDVLVETARASAVDQNVFLGGHSAGTGFTARYAATDFDLSGSGPAEPGYAKLRGLVLLEGGGGSSTGTAPTEQQLDEIEDKADGGLFAAVRDNAPRCVDGTPCTDDSDCAGIGQGTCTEPVNAYAIVPGLLNPRVLAAAEASAVQGLTDPDSGEAVLGVDQGGPRCVDGGTPGASCADDTDCSGGTCEENDAVRQVPDLNALALLGVTSATGGIGRFIDDDGFVSAGATFVRTSVGGNGPDVGGVLTWQDITEEPLPPSVLPDNGPPPTALPAPEWGQEAEITRMDRMLGVFVAGGTNFTDWYFPSSGLGTTTGLPTLDSSALSVGRGRRDIENITQAASVNVPVICFGGSNGLTSVPGDFVAFAQSIGTCTAPSCDGATPRVVNATSPNEAFPTLGGVDGGFEAYISEGYAHVDIVTAEDGPHNQVIGRLVDFLTRNLQ
jgi:pimeloyl-ACP methyl ester carboxylesterase